MSLNVSPDFPRGSWETMLLITHPLLVTTSDDPERRRCGFTNSSFSAISVDLHHRDMQNSTQNRLRPSLLLLQKHTGTITHYVPHAMA